MIRFLFRLLASVALSIAVIMTVLDATRTVATSALVMTPLMTSWSGTSPDTLAAAQDFITMHIHPLAWNPVVTSVLALPGFVVFLALAFLLYAIGHRPARRIGRFVTEG